MANQQHLQTLQSSRNLITQTWDSFEEETRLINQSPNSNRELKNVKENMSSLKTIIKDIDNRITNLHKDQNKLKAASQKMLSEMKEVKYKLQGVVMHEGSAGR